MAAERFHERLDDEYNRSAAKERIEIRIGEAAAREAQSLIYKVHKPLRDVNEKAYVPQIIAIGPYHRGEESFKMMEEHKLRYLQQVIQRQHHVTVADFIAAVAEVEQAARDCYAEPLNHVSSPEFIEMLVLDGCFIVELLWKDVDRYLAADNDPIFQTLWILNSLKRDMMLFENQIPFFVLCRLFDLIEHPYERTHLTYLVQHFFLPLCPRSLYAITETRYRFCLWKLVRVKTRSSIPEKDLLSHRSSEDVRHILDLLQSAWSGSSSEDTPVHGGSRETRFVNSATELRNANVEFLVLGEAKNMLDVEFKNGAFFVPSIRIENSTECVLRNLIAYEQYFPVGRRTPFTDYAVLLDCLVNTSADVKLLSEIGIFDIQSEDDKEAIAGFINRIARSVTLSQPFRYESAFHLINNHYQQRKSRFHDKKNRAIAKLKQDYFNSPWAYISFFAALLLLLLTIAQTVFSAVQLP